MARMVATKTALSVRIDALSDADTKTAEDAPLAGIENRVRLEARLRMLEQGLGITSVRRAVTGASMNKTNGKFALKGNGATYNTGADSLIPSQPPASTSTPSKAVNGTHAALNGDDSMAVDESVTEKDKRKKDKKDKKRKRDAAAEFEGEVAEISAAAPASSSAPADEVVSDEKERKRQKKEAKAAKKLERVAAVEMGDFTLASTAAGDTTNADASTNGLAGDDDEAERKRLKAEKKAAKKAKKAAA